VNGWALLIAMTSLALGQGREPAVYVAAFHDDMISLVDRNTLQSMPSGFVRIWSAVVFLPGENSMFRGQIHKTLFEFDCTERRARMLQGTSYTLEGSSPTIFGAEPTPWEFPIPDTALSEAMKLSCDPVGARDRFGQNQTLDEAVHRIVSALQGNDP